jgi:hypothetical protein
VRIEAILGVYHNQPVGWEAVLSALAALILHHFCIRSVKGARNSAKMTFRSHQAQ